MQALVFDKRLHLATDRPYPEPGPGEALVRVLKTGICNTDMELTKGYLGFQGILGHEFVGVVEGGAMDGQRVAGEINLACGACPTCVGGMPTQCPHRTTLGIDRKDGAMAEYVTLPTANLHPLPIGVSDDQAVFVEPLAAALQTLHLSHISPQDRVVLIGAGKLGLLTAQVVALTGCHLTVIGRHNRQLALAARWGIDGAFPGEVPPRTAGIVIDCTGTPEGFADALELVKPRGAIHLKSTYQGFPQADLTRVVVNEVKIVTSRCGPFAAAIRLLNRHSVDVESLIEARYPLSDALTAFEYASRKGMLKVILDIA